MSIKGAENLPAFNIAGEVNKKLLDSPALVVTAPPGAGKSTLLPLTMLEGLKPKGKILMLEPRRLAARQVAERMAWMLGEQVGGTVGYRIRFETKVGAGTKIEVITEGILTRLLIADPTLEGVDIVIFDEFHERSLDSDLALALTRESARIVRPELRIVLMSATIDSVSLCRETGAVAVQCEGRMFPVKIVHSDEDCTVDDCASRVAAAVRKALAGHEGDILAFLPGEGEIRRCAEALSSLPDGTAVYPLYGNLPQPQQKKAIAPSSAGERKIVLATPIAETSLTIEGVQVVVDSGLYRRMKYNPRSGMNSLETERISMDMARQRSGRAGRVAEGTCYRLWTLSSERRMEENRKAEILSADLCQTVLDVAVCGLGGIEDLGWLTPPPPLQLRQAYRILSALGAFNADGKLTEHGRKLAAFPCHPRMANMLIRAGALQMEAAACDVAAILEERDPLSVQEVGTDLSLRVSQLRKMRREKSGLDGKWRRIDSIAEQYRRLIDKSGGESGRDICCDVSPEDIGALIASAYPERVAQSRCYGHFLLSGGETAGMDAGDSLASEKYLAVASMSAREGAEGRIFLCSPVEPLKLPILAERKVIAWSQKEECVISRREKRIGRLLIESAPLAGTSRDEILQAICQSAEKDGFGMFDFNDRVNDLFTRIAAVRSWHPELDLPEMDARWLLGRCGEWLPLYAGKAGTAAELRKIDLEKVIWGMLDYQQQQVIERIAPDHIVVPTGSRIRLEYRRGADAPVLKVRLQECFGMQDTPRVDEGRRCVLMELLSPGYKPVQLTSDLRNFWKDTYFEVRKELRSRYPRHSWPDNPLEAPPVRGVRRNLDK